MIGKPGAITDRITAYRDGKIDLADLTRFLVEYDYPAPQRYADTEADPVTTMWEGEVGTYDPDRTEMGTWDEVRWNRDVGNLSSADFLIVNRAVWNAHKPADS